MFASVWALKNQILMGPCPHPVLRTGSLGVCACSGSEKSGPDDCGPVPIRILFCGLISLVFASVWALKNQILMGR
jgi:hypothetical protein